MTVGRKRLRRLRRPQLPLGQLDRTIVRLLGLPQRPLGGGDLVMLLTQQLPQRPRGDLDRLPLALRSGHAPHARPRRRSTPNASSDGRPRTSSACSDPDRDRSTTSSAENAALPSTPFTACAAGSRDRVHAAPGTPPTSPRAAATDLVVRRERSGSATRARAGSRRSVCESVPAPVPPDHQSPVQSPEAPQPVGPRSACARPPTPRPGAPRERVVTGHAALAWNTQAGTDQAGRLPPPAEDGQRHRRRPAGAP